MPTLRELELFARLHFVRRPAPGPVPDTDLQVVPLGYEPRAYAEQILGYADRFDVTTLGEREHAGERYPILRVGSRQRADKRLLVLAGVHGNEQAGILAVPELLDAYHGARELHPKVELVVVTPVNPVGAAHLSRFNGEGYDVNRDFVRFDTVEAQRVRDVFDERRPDFAIALHEGPQDATFMFTNQHVERALAERLLHALEAGGTTLATHDYMKRALRPPGLAPMTAAQLAIVKLWAATFGMMATNVFAGLRGVPEITLESSWRSTDRAARVRAHVDLVGAVLRELAG